MPVVGEAVGSSCQEEGVSSTFLSLFSEVATLIQFRVALFVDAERPKSLLLLGCRGGLVARKLSEILPDRCCVIQCDSSYDALACVEGGCLVVADEGKLPFREDSFDFVVCNLVLHRVGDLKAVLARIRSLLKKDGIMIAATFGSGTLYEVKKAMVRAEGTCVSPRIQPFSMPHDLLHDLQHCGFRDPVADVLPIEVACSGLHELLHGLKRMGGDYAFYRNLEPLSGKVAEEAWYLYRQPTAREHAAEASVKFEVVMLKGGK
ncbi:MAG: methyltransferase domain-containing protein [Anaplasma sp.]